jgi:hypothetical protein
VIQLVDQMLEQMLRAEVPLSRDVDVSFTTPDRKWGGGVTNPTINLFLWDIRVDLDRAESGYVHRTAEDGSARRLRPDPSVTFRYLVTSWASEHRDEHQLLGAVLRCILRTEVVDPAHLPEVFGDIGDVEIELAPGDPRNKDFWSSLDGQLKPGLDVVLTMVVPLDVEYPLGPEIEGFEIAVNLEPDGVPPPEKPPGREARITRTRRGRSIVTSATEGQAPS